MFLACKLSETPRRTRDVINAVHYTILSHKKHPHPGYLDSFSTEYSELEKNMYRAEMYILKCLGFHIHVTHPHIWALNYLRVLGFIDHPMVQTTWNFLNDSYRTVVHCLHQPNVIATACIFLASCTHQLLLPNPWYLLFDVHANDMFQVASHIEALYSIRLRFDLPLSTSELTNWVTPNIETQLTLEAYLESLEKLKQKQSGDSTTTLSLLVESEKQLTSSGSSSALSISTQPDALHLKQSTGVPSSINSTTVAISTVTTNIGSSSTSSSSLLSVSPRRISSPRRSKSQTSRRHSSHARYHPYHSSSSSSSSLSTGSRSRSRYSRSSGSMERTKDRRSSHSHRRSSPSSGSSYRPLQRENTKVTKRRDESRGRKYRSSDRYSPSYSSHQRHEDSHYRPSRR